MLIHRIDPVCENEHHVSTCAAIYVVDGGPGCTARAEGGEETAGCERNGRLFWRCDCALLLMLMKCDADSRSFGFILYVEYPLQPLV